MSSLGQTSILAQGGMGPEEEGQSMLYLSEVMIQNPQIESFEDLVELIRERAKSEMFFRIDVKPSYDDTPENWEDRLEAAFS